MQNQSSIYEPFDYALLVMSSIVAILLIFALIAFALIYVNSRKAGGKQDTASMELPGHIKVRGVGLLGFTFAVLAVIALIVVLWIRLADRAARWDTARRHFALATGRAEATPDERAASNLYRALREGHSYDDYARDATYQPTMVNPTAERTKQEFAKLIKAMGHTMSKKAEHDLQVDSQTGRVTAESYAKLRQQFK